MSGRISNESDVLAERLQIAELSKERCQGRVMRLDLAMHRGVSRRGQGNLKWRMLEPRHRSQNPGAGIIDVNVDHPAPGGDSFDLATAVAGKKSFRRLQRWFQQLLRQHRAGSEAVNACAVSITAQVDDPMKGLHPDFRFQEADFGRFGFGPKQTVQSI